MSKRSNSTSRTKDGMRTIRDSRSPRPPSLKPAVSRRRFRRLQPQTRLSVARNLLALAGSRLTSYSLPSLKGPRCPSEPFRAADRDPVWSRRGLGLVALPTRSSIRKDSDQLASDQSLRRSSDGAIGGHLSRAAEHKKDLGPAGDRGLASAAVVGPQTGHGQSAEARYAPCSRFHREG